MADTEMNDAPPTPPSASSPQQDNKSKKNNSSMSKPNSTEGAGSAQDPRTAESAFAVRSVEGWIIMVTNLHEETSEEDLSDFFADFGEVRMIHMNLDRRTGYAKGYAMIEFSTLPEAEAAIKGANGERFLEQRIGVDFAFVRPPPKLNSGGGGGGAGAGGGGPKGGRKSGRGGQRSRSPGAERRGDSKEGREGD